MVPKFREENDVPSSWIIDRPIRPTGPRPHTTLSHTHQFEWDFRLLDIKQGPSPSTREHVMDEFRRNGTKDTPYFPEVEKNGTKWDYENRAERTVSHNRTISSTEILSSSNIGYRAHVLHHSSTYRNTSTPKPPAEHYIRELNKAKSNESCRLCKSNGELPSVYLTHKLKDEYGLVTCPVLKQYTCELCGATGPLAHTLKYCPHATREERQQCTAILRSVRSNSSRRRRYNSEPRDLTGNIRRLHIHQSQ